MSFVHEFRRMFWKVGYDISRYTTASHPLARKKRMIEVFGIDTVLDVGANAGQFGRQLRRDLGYSGRILSFEPLSSAFKSLRENSKNDPEWQVFNYAIGDAEGTAEINISGNSQSSSLLRMLARHEASDPDSRYTGSERVTIKTIDSLFDELCSDAANVYMKVDTQGFEGRVLKGAEACLPHIDTVQLEMSVVPLYEGGGLLMEMCSLMREKGYQLVALEEGFCDLDSGHLLQVDGTFHRFSR